MFEEAEAMTERLYRTAAGSEVRQSGKYGGIFLYEVCFDWFEEDACIECVPQATPVDGCLVWDCECCGGGSAELTEVIP